MISTSLFITSYNLCLKYPSSYSPKEVCDNFKKYNCYVEDSPQDLVDIINEELSTNYDKDAEILLENVAIDNSVCIELHTQEYTQPIKYYNEDEKYSKVICNYRGQINMPNMITNTLLSKTIFF